MAASVVTNMAAGGSAELCDSALSVAPHLIGFLNSQNIALVDQSAWALGNIAAEGPKFRDRLKDNGVLAPLIKLLDSKVRIQSKLGRRVRMNFFFLPFVVTPFGCSIFRI